jgi:hypothetical protein
MPMQFVNGNLLDPSTLRLAPLLALFAPLFREAHSPHVA